jgi:hypothetical protein
MLEESLINKDINNLFNHGHIKNNRNDDIHKDY